MTPILARLREPSSHAGLAVLFGLFGVQFAPETWHAIIQAISAFSALLAVVLGEGKR